MSSQNFKIKNGLTVNDIEVIDGAGNYVGLVPTAQGAFEKANSATILAQAAFNTANTGGGGTTDQFARDTANTSSILAQAAFNTANNSTDTWVRSAANSASSYANSAYTQANTGTILAQAAFDVGNTALLGATSAGSYANSAYLQANTSTTNASTADQKAVTSGDYANSAYAFANTRYSSSGGTIDGDVSISGNLSILGNVVSHSSDDFIVNDPIVLLANNNISNLTDLGFVAHYIENGNTLHTGLVKDVSENKWYLFDNYVPHVQENNLIDPNDVTFALATLSANIVTSVISVRGYDPINHTNNAYTQANSSYTLANSAYTLANSAIISDNGAASFANGSVTAPSITTVGDLNTGIFFPAADTIAFAEGGVERLRLTTNGGVAFSGESNFGTSGQVLQSNGDAAPTWVTPSSGGGYAISVIGTNTTAVKGTLYVLTASLTLTLPASPTAGDQVAVSNLSGTTTAVIGRNGQKIMNLSEDMTIDVVSAGITLVYTGATYGWVTL
jgi:hypothetical protein